MPRRVKEPRTKHLIARISPAEQEMLQRAADAEFLSVAAWTRQTLFRRAAEILEVPLPAGQSEVGCRSAGADLAGQAHRTRCADWPRFVDDRRTSRALDAAMLSCGELGAFAL